MKQNKKNNNKPRECTICGKAFASGKAMGGHKRAHFVNHPISPAAIIKKKAVHFSSESTHNQAAESFMLNSNASNESSSQSKSSTGTRSKRRGKFLEKEAEPKEAEEEQPVSSKPDPEVHHAAEILMDIQFAWRSWLQSQEAEMSRSTEVIKGEPRLSVNRVERQKDSIQLNGFHNEEEANVLVHAKPLGQFQTLIGATCNGSRFNCETSKKIFRSNHALSLYNEEEFSVQFPKMQHDKFPSLNGGTCTESRFKAKTCHLALSFQHESYKEVQSKMEDNEDDDSGSGGYKEVQSKMEDNEDDDSGSGDYSGSVNDAVEDEKRHQCPVCFKVFTSCQGLGGHKRVHMANAGAGKDKKPSPTKKLRPSFDLNLPAPDLDEEVISIGDLSTSSSDE